MSLRHGGRLGCFRVFRLEIRKIMINDARSAHESFRGLVVLEL